jgi:hypothetical protein
MSLETGELPLEAAGAAVAEANTMMEEDAGQQYLPAPPAAAAVNAAVLELAPAPAAAAACADNADMAWLKSAVAEVLHPQEEQQQQQQQQQQEGVPLSRDRSSAWVEHLATLSMHMMKQKRLRQQQQ